MLKIPCWIAIFTKIARLGNKSQRTTRCKFHATSARNAKAKTECEIFLFFSRYGPVDNSHLSIGHMSRCLPHLESGERSMSAPPLGSLHLARCVGVCTKRPRCRSLDTRKILFLASFLPFYFAHFSCFLSAAPSHRPRGDLYRP